MKFLRFAWCCLAVWPGGMLRGQEVLDGAKLNGIFGVRIWADGNLWDDEEGVVAERLGWPMESRTEEQASYRLYPGEEVRVLQARPYSLALYGEEGRPAQVSMVFINKGDYAELGRMEVDLWRAMADKDREAEKKIRVEYKEAYKNFPEALKAEAAAVEQLLGGVLGPAARDKSGEGRNLRERVLRWDWEGHAILLSVQEDEFVSVRIVPSGVADNGGRAGSKTDTEMKEDLRKRVVRRDNGDVILTGIPMVNQGPKGYCVPATWERYLRYLGIPADLYVLAMTGRTELGGGTNSALLLEQVADLVNRFNRRLDRERGSVNPKNLAGSIDEGLPLMWALYVDAWLDREITVRSKERLAVSDWAAWKAKLKEFRKGVGKSLNLKSAFNHYCLVTGYNVGTGEVAISDSWGPEYEERWLTEEEAGAISMGELWIIHW